MDQREELAALDKALVKLGDMAEHDQDMALAMEIVQAERAEAEYGGEFGGAFAGEPKEPVRKEVVGIGTGAGALLVLAVAERFGLPMDPILAAGIAGAVGGFFAWAKSESYFVG